MDINDYRQLILEIILSEKHVSRPVFELRLVLFIRAANYYYSHDASPCLEPFPSFFFHPATRTRLYDDLKTHISNIPPLDTIKESTLLPELTWRLLHWIFTNPLDITAITESELSAFYTDDIRETTKLHNIPYPRKTCIRYDITPPVPNKAFIAGKKQYGSFFAFHGSPSQNFHSIIHRGLICSLNVASAYGYGTYLSNDIKTAKGYAKKMDGYHNYQSSYPTTHQLSNLTQVTSSSLCIAIVEVVNHPSIKKVDIGGAYRSRIHQQSTNDTNDADNSNSLKYYVVDRDEFMQLRNLIVFY